MDYKHIEFLNALIIRLNKKISVLMCLDMKVNKCYLCQYEYMIEFLTLSKEKTFIVR